MSPRFWLYKCNDAEGGPSGYGGDWRVEVFAPGEVVDWGGHYSTRSPEVAKRLDEDVNAGDVIVCYQTDKKVIVGFCRVEKLTGPPGEKHLWLEPIHELKKPLAIHAAKRGTVLEHSLAVNGRVMMRELNAPEMKEIILLSGAPQMLTQARP